jgi:hypothetical protein
MTAGIYNATIDQGATWSVTVLYKNSDGTAINLTGFTAAMQVRQQYSSETAELTLSSPSNGIVITGATGTVLITISAAQTRALEEGYYVYDVELTSPSALVTRLIQGQLTVAPEVTRV